MTRRRRAFALMSIFALLVLAVAASGCAQTQAEEKDYWRELPPGAHALRKITDPAQIPDFTRAFSDTARLDETCANSLNYLSKPSAAQFFPVSGISHEQVRLSLQEFRAMLAGGMNAAELNAELRRRFDVYTTVGYDNQGSVLFTGYYTPIFEASLTKDHRFRFPLHKLPPDHVKDPVTGQTLGLKQPDGSINPNYPSRTELMQSGMLEGLELVWLADPVEAYVIQVQGSAILSLPDGSRLEVGYAGTNGAEYKSLGLEMVKRGMLKREELNLRSIMRYFRQHPNDFEAVVAANPRYIFFQQNSGGPYGSLNEPVIQMRSIATDKSIFPRGSLVFVEADISARGTKERLSRFMLDQDTGGAIRAPGRCDLYWGVGEGAERYAGRTFNEGRMYYLILKDSEMERLKSRVER